MEEISWKDEQFLQIEKDLENKNNFIYCRLDKGIFSNQKNRQKVKIDIKAIKFYNDMGFTVGYNDKFSYLLAVKRQESEFGYNFYDLESNYTDGVYNYFFVLIAPFMKDKNCSDEQLISNCKPFLENEMMITLTSYNDLSHDSDSCDERYLVQLDDDYCAMYYGFINKDFVVKSKKVRSRKIS